MLCSLEATTSQAIQLQLLATQCRRKNTLRILRKNCARNGENNERKNQSHINVSRTTWGIIVGAAASFAGLSASVLLVNGYQTLRGAILSDFDCGGGNGSGNLDQFPLSWGGDGNSGQNSYKILFQNGSDQKEDEAVAICIPALNEEQAISGTLSSLKELHPPAQQIIVVDGGSADRTVEIAKKHGAIVISGERGRAVQMNSGAQMAMKKFSSNGGIICFLHADTVVPKDFVAIVRNALRDKRTILIGFVPIISVPKGIMWGMSLHNVVKTWYAAALLRPLGALRGLRCLFGDQVMCCRASDFFSVGGFDQRFAIMEDANLCERLHALGGAKRGRIRMLSRGVVTSGRRMAEWGPLKSLLIQIVIGYSYAFGMSPDRLKKLFTHLYKNVR